MTQPRYAPVLARVPVPANHEAHCEPGGRCRTPCKGAAGPACRSWLSRFMFTYLALVSPPVALAIDVFARSLAEVGRADDEDLEALRPGLVASPRTGRDAHRVPFLELDD